MSGFSFAILPRQNNCPSASIAVVSAMRLLGLVLPLTTGEVKKGTVPEMKSYNGT